MESKGFDPSTNSRLEESFRKDHIQVLGPITSEFSEILTPQALQFVAKLQRQFGPAREALLQRRKEVQARIDAGKFPDFLPETKDIRESDWKVAPVPSDIQDRRVEITGPV